MEISPQDMRSEIRPIVVRRGPVKVMKRLSAQGVDMSAPIFALAQKGVGAGVLKVLQANPPGGSAPDTEATLTQWLDLIVTPSRRLPKQLRPVADKLALLMLDAWWEEDETCGLVCAHVIHALGKSVRYREFDGGSPGSGQSVGAWKLGGTTFLISSEIGVYEIQ